MLAPSVLPDDVAHAFLGDGEWRPARVSAQGKFILFEGGAMAHASTVAIDGLAEAALVALAAGSGLDRSNVGGFHSEDNVFETCVPARQVLDAARAVVQNLPQPPRDEPAVLYTVTEIQGARHLGDNEPRILVADRPLDHKEAEAWFNVSDVGNYNCLHSHRGASWSGVVFVQAPPPCLPPVEHSAHLLFCLRHPELGGPPGLYAAFAPRPGTMLIFPSSLKHAVLPIAPDALLHISHRDDRQNCPPSLPPSALRISLSFNLF